MRNCIISKFPFGFEIDFQNHYLEDMVCLRKYTKKAPGTLYGHLLNVFSTP